MTNLGRIFTLLQLYLFILVSLNESASAKSRSKKKITKEVKEINICDLENQDAPIYCYCVPHRDKNTTEAQCVVFNKFDVNHPIWSQFVNRPAIDTLTFAVKHTGSFTYIPSQVLKQLRYLRVFTVQYGKIHEIPEHAFSNITTLAEINLSRNMIVVLRPWAFEHMINLSIVNLEENRIGEVNRDVFMHLPSMQKLLLSRNNITILHDKAFKHLSSLKELELNGNQISVITSDSFNGLSSLTRLDLRNNLISMVGDRTFIEMPELRELELDQNQIEYISEKALEGMRNLQKLRLSENKLVNLDPDFLAGAPGIYLLDLRDNALRTMTFDNIKPIVTNLYNSTSNFFLDDNKLICDCKLAWIWGLRNETKNPKLRDSLEVLTCFMETKNKTVALNEEAERNRALEIARNQERYALHKSGRGKDSDNYMDDGVDDDDYDLYQTIPETGSRIEVIEGKTGVMKHLFELKLEELPCPEPSREDLMASEQPSSRHGHAHFGTSGTTRIARSSSAVLCLALSLVGFTYLRGLKFT